jgi:hypothetical protein
MGQIVRALEQQGALAEDELERVVGAAYWEGGRFDRAFAVADGLVVRSPDGRFSAV